MPDDLVCTCPFESRFTFSPRQCATGARVFQIAGDEKSMAVFFLHPLGKSATPDDIEIDRELAFVSGDGGTTWTAAG